MDRVIKHLNRLPKAVMELPPLKVLKKGVDVALEVMF